MDPYSGKRRITEEARIKQEVEASLLQKVKSWNKPDRDRRSRKKEERKDRAPMDGNAKISKLCKAFNSPEGCSSQGDCPKGEHKCSRRKGDFVCQRTGHNRQNCDHPKFKEGGQ